MTKGMDDTMADTKLFNIKGTVKEYQSGTVTLEKELQTVKPNEFTSRLFALDNRSFYKHNL